MKIELVTNNDPKCTKHRIKFKKFEKSDFCLQIVKAYHFFI